MVSHPSTATANKLSSSTCAGARCALVATGISGSSAHSRTNLQHGGGFCEGSGEGTTFQLQGDREGEQVHHSDVWKHHE